MKRWNSLLTTGSACGLLMFGPLQAGRADEPGWGLALKSQHLGTLFLYVIPAKDANAGGFALAYPKTGAKFVMHAPNWNVVMYNEITKSYYVESLEDLKQYGARTIASDVKAHAKLNGTRTGTTGSVAGTQATQYFINTSSNSGPKQIEAWIAADIKAPRQLGALLGKLFSIDTSNFPPGLPLRVKIADDSGKRELLYDTVKIAKQQIKSAAFTYPATYKHVNSELEVFVDERGRAKIGKILEDSNELTRLLGSSDNTKSTYGRPSTSANAQTYGPTGFSGATTYTPARTTSAATQPTKPNDWWGNILSWFGMGPK